MHVLYFSIFRPLLRLLYPLKLLLVLCALVAPLSAKRVTSSVGLFMPNDLNIGNGDVGRSVFGVSRMPAARDNELRIPWSRSPPSVRVCAGRMSTSSRCTTSRQDCCCWVNEGVFTPPQIFRRLRKPDTRTNNPAMHSWQNLIHSL